MTEGEPIMREEQVLADLIGKARMVFICGNGGSASTAEHFTTDLVKKGIPAFCLNSNVSVITMIANDYGYDEIFKRQLEVVADEEDLLITISCSGTSPNIEKVKEVADSLMLNIYSFEVFDEDRDYGKLEDKHLKFAHEVAGLL